MKIWYTKEYYLGMEKTEIIGSMNKTGNYHSKQTQKDKCRMFSLILDTSFKYLDTSVFKLDYL